MPKLAQTQQPAILEKGMIVYCETTYRKFHGRIVESLGTSYHHPGPSYMVLSFMDGNKYPVYELCMKRVAYDWRKK